MTKPPFNQFHMYFYDRNPAETDPGTFLSNNSMAIVLAVEPLFPPFASQIQGACLGISYNIQPLFRVRVGRERGRWLYNGWRIGRWQVPDGNFYDGSVMKSWP